MLWRSNMPLVNIVCICYDTCFVSIRNGCAWDEIKSNQMKQNYISQITRSRLLVVVHLNGMRLIEINLINVFKGKWIQIRWKWHHDVCLSDTLHLCCACRGHPLFLTIIFWSAHPKMVKCAHGIWLMANAKRMLNFHKCILAFRYELNWLALHRLRNEFTRNNSIIWTFSGLSYVELWWYSALL